MFYNFTSKPFTGKWDSKLYTFQPGQVAEGNRIIISDDGQHSVLLTEAVEDVFGHMLAIDILNHPDLQTNFTYNDKGEAIPQDMKQMLVYSTASIDALKKRAKSAPEVPVEYPASLERFLKETATEVVAVPEEPKEVAPVEEVVATPKPRGRPKKVEASPSENVEFAIPTE